MVTRTLQPIVSLLLSLTLAEFVVVNAQETAAKSNQPSAAGGQADNSFPDLTIPKGADTPKLQQLVALAKSAKPTTADQYKSQQLAIRTASSQLIRLIGKDQPGYSQAEIDMIISSVALLTFFNESEQTDIVTKVQEFLKSRNPLVIQDIQTGMMAAGMMELQPDKQPAREIYSLLDELLKEDKREEMQSLRLNLQASVRRLDMLGSKFELEATTVDGQPIKTDDFAGKIVIVDVFATWCESCLAELPLIKAHYEKYHNRGLDVISISMDDDVQALHDYLKQNPLPWSVIHDGAENPLDRMSLKYGISALPTVLLLNKEGTVVSLEARNSELNRLMQMLFEAPTPAKKPAAEAADEAAEAEGSPSEQSTATPTNAK